MSIADALGAASRAIGSWFAPDPVRPRPPAAPPSPVELLQKRMAEASDTSPAVNAAEDAKPDVRTPRPRATARIFLGPGDGRSGEVALGDAQQVLREGPEQARMAATHVQMALDYFQRRFGRNGIDGAGSAVDVVVDDRTTGDDGREIFRGNGSFYVTGTGPSEREALHFGTGVSYVDNRGRQVNQRPMQASDDLTIHELAHGIIRHETGVIGGTQDEAGAVAEAVADVFAASATRDWRIGESLYAPGSGYSAMRDIANPNSDSTLHTLWTSMSQYRQDGGRIEEHEASGILSTAAMRIEKRIGWESLEELFYTTLTSGSMQSMGFADTAAALRATAQQLWGTSGKTAVVDQELSRAGL